jgi:hypothetical protein
MCVRFFITSLCPLSVSLCLRLSFYFPLPPPISTTTNHHRPRRPPHHRSAWATDASLILFFLNVSFFSSYSPPLLRVGFYLCSFLPLLPNRACFWRGVACPLIFVFVVILAGWRLARGALCDSRAGWQSSRGRLVVWRGHCTFAYSRVLVRLSLNPVLPASIRVLVIGGGSAPSRQLRRSSRCLEAGWRRGHSWTLARPLPPPSVFGVATAQHPTAAWASGHLGVRSVRPGVFWGWRVPRPIPRTVCSRLPFSLTLHRVSFPILLLDGFCRGRGCPFTAGGARARC